MQLKESHTMILLLSIILISSVFKPKKVKIPENTITIIGKNQIPIFPSRSITNDKIYPDTSKFVSSNKNSKFGKNWMKRYKSGIKFKFHPPN